MLKAQIDKSIASAWESNVGVPATKTKERMQTTVQLSNKLINWTHWHVIQKYLTQANLHFSLNYFHYQRQPGVLHMKSYNLLPLILRVKEFSQRINITGLKLPFCCLTRVVFFFFFTCFAVSPSWCKEERKRGKTAYFRKIAPMENLLPCLYRGKKELYNANKWKTCSWGELGGPSAITEICQTWKEEGSKDFLWFQILVSTGSPNPDYVFISLTFSPVLDLRRGYS